MDGDRGVREIRAAADGPAGGGGPHLLHPAEGGERLLTGFDDETLQSNLGENLKWITEDMADRRVAVPGIMVAAARER
jgi:hypothetical protein